MAAISTEVVRDANEKVSKEQSETSSAEQVKRLSQDQINAMREYFSNTQSYKDGKLKALESNPLTGCKGYKGPESQRFVQSYLLSEKDGIELYINVSIYVTKHFALDKEATKDPLFSMDCPPNQEIFQIDIYNTQLDAKCVDCHHLILVAKGNTLGFSFAANHSDVTGAVEETIAHRFKLDNMRNRLEAGYKAVANVLNDTIVLKRSAAEIEALDAALNAAMLESLTVNATAVTALSAGASVVSTKQMLRELQRAQQAFDQLASRSVGASPAGGAAAPTPAAKATLTFNPAAANVAAAAGAVAPMDMSRGVEPAPSVAKSDKPFHH
jgi:hypothetical protein